MMEFHRVFTRWDDSVWVGVSWYAQQGELTNELEYTVLPVARQGDVCMTLPDERILCDYGPEHDHDRP